MNANLTQAKETQRDRLIKFIRFRKLNKHSFLVTCGISKSYIESMKNGGIGPKVRKKIEQGFPELNLNWVITGEGTMLRDTHIKASSFSNVSNVSPYQEKLDSLQSDIYTNILAEKDLIIEHLLKDNQRLYSIIARLISNT